MHETELQIMGYITDPKKCKILAQQNSNKDFLSEISIHCAKSSITNGQNEGQRFSYDK
jgi:hypothetical protein